MFSAVEQKLRMDKKRRLDILTKMRSDVRQLGALVGMEVTVSAIVAGIDTLYTGVVAHAENIRSEAVKIARMPAVQPVALRRRELGMVADHDYNKQKDNV